MEDDYEFDINELENVNGGISATSSSVSNAQLKIQIKMLKQQGKTMEQVIQILQTNVETKEDKKKIESIVRMWYPIL
ncbi:hypothetical protein SAMN02910456_01281 [Ruminococcaceae bacterium YRB3002]|nr:hypothetical protein SAMN02910456_01281 [Ruminococcaceae bacterium YRB3002]